MWKKDNNPDHSHAGANSPSDSQTPAAGPSSVMRPPPPARTSKGNASALSADLIFNGKIRGNSDIVISGKLEGSIELPDNTVTIELSGKVNASSISAKVIIVLGTVEGSLSGRELVQVMSSGNVLGDIKSEKVVLDNGCKFNGTIETVNSMKEAPRTAKPSRPSPPVAPQSHPKSAAPGTKPESSPSSKLA